MDFSRQIKWHKDKKTDLLFYVAMLLLVAMFLLVFRVFRTSYWLLLVPRHPTYPLALSSTAPWVPAQLGNLLCIPGVHHTATVPAQSLLQDLIPSKSLLHHLTQPL